MKKERIYTYCLVSDRNLMAFYRLSYIVDGFVDVAVYVFPQYLHCLPGVFGKLEYRYQKEHLIKGERLPNFDYEPLNLSSYEIEFYTQKFKILTILNEKP